MEKGLGVERKVLALIKNLIYLRVERCAQVTLRKDQSKEMEYCQLVQTFALVN